MRFGSGEYVYEYCEGWGQTLSEFEDDKFGLKKVSDVGFGPDGRVYLLTRSRTRPIIIADTEGNYITHWEFPEMGRPHNIAFDKYGFVYITDDEKHVVYKVDSNGNIVMCIGTPGVCSDTGYEWKDYRTIKRAAGPFNRPTGVSIAGNGDIYVADGYGNARVHRFSAEGELLASWGEPGMHPGQFFLPHGIMVHNDIVYVADRENSRIQLFDLKGNFLNEWKQLHRPSLLKIGPDGLAYICEIKRNDQFGDFSPSRFCIMTLDGELVARIDSSSSAQPFVHYHAAHGLAVDNEGSVYIGEVGSPIEGHLGIKKYRRV